MSLKTILEDVKEQVRKIVPPNIEITNIDFEGPNIVIYTTSLDEFANNNDIVKQLAQSLRRRFAIRPDPSQLADLDQAETEIRHIIPKDAQITDINFETDTGEVTIEAIQPGVAIGKHGAILNQIKRRIGWAPKVVRSPPIPSKTIQEIRQYLHNISDQRKDFLKAVGRKIYKDIPKGENWVRMTTLGGYREVGRSCTLLSTKNSKVLIDLGVNVSSEADPTPYLNAPEVTPLDSVDCVVITHAHLDHAGLLPVMFKYGFKGPVYCTPPTRDLMSLLQLDYLKVTVAEGRKAPYESKHIRETVAHCIPLRYGETTDIAADIRLTLQNAGHILGSAICHFHVNDGLHNVLFTGDMKYERTWLFNPTVNRFPRVETLIIESTYGSHNDFQPPRKEASNHLRGIIARTVRRGGKVLIPVFAVGRSQEVMIVIEQWMRSRNIKDVPVYLDGMIQEATAIHTAYPEYLNNQLRNQIFQRGENPFLSEIFNHVDNRDKREKILDEPGPAITLATSGMLNGGPVMEYFKVWAPEKKNTLVFVGYQVDGTIGRKVQRGMNKIQLHERGHPVEVEINLDTQVCDGFSGHSDRKQLVSYIATLDPRPERIIMGHGEESKCLEFSSAIFKKYGIETRAPMNLETIRFR